MKKLTTLIFAMLFTLAAMAQTPEVAYCSIGGSDELGYKKGRVFINYGQDDAKRDWLVDEHGEVISFATLIHAANYLAKYGWRIVSVSKTDTYTIILEKRIVKPEDITEGIMTRHLYLERNNK